MKKPWLLPLIILAIAALAGVAVAGNPSDGDTTRLTAEDEVAAAVTTTTIAVGPPATADFVVAATATTVIYIPRTTTTTVVQTAVPAPITIAPPVQTIPSTTRPIAPTTARPTATTPTTPTTPKPATTTPVTFLTLPPTTPAITADTTATTTAPTGPNRVAGDVLVAMANPTVDNPDTTDVDEYTVVQRQLEVVGYQGPITVAALMHSQATLVYYKPGFLEFATVLSTDLVVPIENVLPYPATKVTGNYDDLGNSYDDIVDVIAVIGIDWPTPISVTATTTTSVASSPAETSTTTSTTTSTASTVAAGERQPGRG